MKLPHQKPPAEIWIVDDDQSMRWVLEKTKSNNGYRVTAFESGPVARSSRKRATPDARPRPTFTDGRMPGRNGSELRRQVINMSPQSPVSVTTAYSDLDTPVPAFQEGAFEDLPQPVDIDDVLERVARACEPVDEVSPGQHPRPSIEVDAWQTPLRRWAKQQLAQGETGILKNAARAFEKTLLDCALEATRGRKQDAARLLGWGRNTLA
ncbi:MAG: response regulator, partial [Halieaceae bacterium]|nr:response regulator [Halieaceae bacterium]